MCNKPKFDFTSATTDIFDPSKSIFTLCSTEPTLGNPYLEKLYGTTIFTVFDIDIIDSTKVLVTVNSDDTIMIQNIIFPFKKMKGINGNCIYMKIKL
jgi:hypothetical protein